MRHDVYLGCGTGGKRIPGSPVNVRLPLLLKLRGAGSSSAASCDEIIRREKTKRERERERERGWFGALSSLYMDVYLDAALPHSVVYMYAAMVNKDSFRKTMKGLGTVERAKLFLLLCPRKSRLYFISLITAAAEQDDEGKEEGEKVVILPVSLG